MAKINDGIAMFSFKRQSFKFENWKRKDQLFTETLNNSKTMKKKYFFSSHLLICLYNLNDVIINLSPQKLLGFTAVIGRVEKHQLHAKLPQPDGTSENSIINHRWTTEIMFKLQVSIFLWLVNLFLNVAYIRLQCERNNSLASNAAHQVCGIKHRCFWSHCSGFYFFNGCAAVPNDIMRWIEEW